MESRIMQVFYGNDCLPYKDIDRTVHYPIVGNSFVGASNTTEIRFYVDQIGSADDTWVANSKLPNGKIGNQILTKGHDSELDLDYVALTLSSFYTQAKGDLYISLNGFYGGVEVVGLDENGEETDVESDIVTYSIKGIPTIQATGCIKIAINYATPLQDQDEIEEITLARLLAEIGTKLGKDENKYLKVVSSLANLNTLEYQNYIFSGDVIFSKNEKDFYLISGTYPSLTATSIPLTLHSNLNILTAGIGVQGSASIGGSISSGGNITASAGLIDGLRIKASSLANYLFGDDNLENYITTYVASQISGASDTYVTLATEQTISGHKTFTTTISANQGVNFGNGANVNMYNGYILNNRAKLFGIGTSSDNRTFYQFPYGSISGNTHGESNPYTIATEDFVEDYAYSKQDVYTKNEIDTKLTSMLVYKGTKTVSELNALVSSLGSENTGWFYNISNSGVLTWTENGSTQTLEVLAGDNVCWTGSGWDKLTMDLSAYDDKFIAAGFFEVQNYDEDNGTITFVYASDLYSMSYDSNTGIMTIEAN